MIRRYTKAALSIICGFVGVGLGFGVWGMMRRLIDPTHIYRGSRHNFVDLDYGIGALAGGVIALLVFDATLGRLLAEKNPKGSTDLVCRACGHGFLPTTEAHHQAGYCSPGCRTTFEETGSSPQN